MIIHRRGILGLGAALALGGVGTARAITYAPPERWLYFDYGSAELSPEAVQIIIGMKSEFDAWAGPSQIARYELIGSIDGQETAARLKPLVGRRIEAVTKVMLTSGVTPAQISVRRAIPGDFPHFERGEEQPLARAVHVQRPFVVHIP
jgi:hypothetical protein